MQKIIPFFWYNYNADEALELYSSVFGKNMKVTSKSYYGDAGPGPKGALLVGTIELFGQPISLLNGGPVYKLSPAASLLINCDNQEEVDYYWNKLLVGGQEDMCGWLRDKFGLSWQVVPEILGKLMQDKDVRKAGNVMAAMLKMKKIIIKDLEAAYNQ